MKKNFPNLKRNKVKAFIQAVSAVDEYAVTRKEWVVVPKRSNIQVPCHVITQPFKEDMTLLFQPDLNPRWPDGLELHDLLVRVKKNVFPIMRVCVSNTTDHDCDDIVLPGRTLMDTVQTSMSALPVQAFDNIGKCVPHQLEPHN